MKTSPKIMLEGIPKKYHEEIEAEIHYNLDLFFKGVHIPIKEIIVPLNFNEKINEIAQIENYDQKREYGLATAKTMQKIINGNIFFYLIFDNNLFLNVGLKHKLERISYFIHEFTHVFDEYDRYKNQGPKSVENMSKVEYFYENAWTIWMEYNAESNVYFIYNTLENSKLMTVNYDFKINLFNQVIKYFTNLHSFLRSKKKKLKNKNIDLEVATSSISMYILDMLMLYSYMLGFLDYNHDYSEYMDRLENTMGYKSLSTYLKQLNNTLHKLKENKTYSPEHISKIGILINEIFLTCGLEIVKYYKDSIEVKLFQNPLFERKTT